jgi:hypothetical protein
LSPPNVIASSLDFFVSANQFVFGRPWKRSHSIKDYHLIIIDSSGKHVARNFTIATGM